jgi:hypothetical protein
LIYKKDIRVSNRNKSYFIHLFSYLKVWYLWAMTHDSLCNECQDKRISKVMRCFAGSMRKPWEDVVWSHMKKCSMESRCGCESHIYMAWRVRQIGWHIRWNNDLFLKFSRSMNREEAINGWCRYSLRVMKKCNDDWHDGW